MQEAIVFQRRNRLKKHYVNTSNVLLYGYLSLSDAAKITFQVIDSFDWEDKGTGDSKGFVFPAIDTLARIRNASDRTIRRHLEELEKEKLLTRVRRRNKPSLLIIENISEKEVSLYLKSYVDKPEENTQLNPESGDFLPSNESRTDKNVHSDTHGERTKMSIAYKNKKDEVKENENNVNEDLKSKRNGGVTQLKDLLIRFEMKIPSKIKTKQKNDWKIEPINRDKRDYLASEMAERLSDRKSLGCFKTIAEKVPEVIIFEVLSSIKETAAEGKIKRSRGALFVDVIKSYCEAHDIELGFDTKQPFQGIVESERGMFTNGLRKDERL